MISIIPIHANVLAGLGSQQKKLYSPYRCTISIKKLQNTTNFMTKARTTEKCEALNIEFIPRLPRYGHVYSTGAMLFTSTRKHIVIHIYEHMYKSYLAQVCYNLLRKISLNSIWLKTIFDR